MRQIRVLITSPCQGAYGGIEAFVLAIAEAVRREPGFEVRVVFKKIRDFELTSDMAAMIQHENVEFVERGGLDLARAVRWADIVHLQNASPDVVALAKIFGKHLVLTIHNYMTRDGSIHHALWRMGARLADARWYNSQFVWDTWEPRQKRRGSRKVHTISRLTTGSIDPAARRGFTFIGRWIANKGIETLVDAYAIADIDRIRWPLLLMGDGPLRASIIARLERNAMRAEHPGFVDATMKIDRISRTRWMVVPPSTNEDFGLTAIEARSLGVPCIVTRDGGLPEAAGKQALVCEPRDVQGLARLLEQAAGMSEDEYCERAMRTREDLSDELEPVSVYPAAYRAIVRGERVN